MNYKNNDDPNYLDQDINRCPPNDNGATSIDQLYSNVQNQISEIKKNNNGYSRETISQRKSIDIDKYNSYKQQLIEDFRKEKELKLGGEIEIEQDKFKQYQNPIKDASRELESMNPPISSNSTRYELRSKMGSSLQNVQGASDEGKVKIREMINSRMENMPSMSNLKVIQERESEEDKKHQMQSYLFRESEGNPIQEMVHSRVEKSQKPAWNILDESSNLYSVYNQNDQNRLDKTVSSNFVLEDELAKMQKGGLKRSNFNLPSPQNPRRFSAISRNTKNETEKDQLKKQNVQLQARVRELEIKNRDMNSLIQKNLELEDTIRNLRNQVASIKRSDRKEGSKSVTNEQIYVSESGIVSPFHRNHNLDAENRDISSGNSNKTKLKFADSVLDMVSQLLSDKEQQMKENQTIKKSWKVLKRVVSEYFELKKLQIDVSTHKNQNKVMKEYNLPTATKDIVYRDLKNLSLNRAGNGVQSEKYLKRDLRAGHFQSDGFVDPLKSSANEAYRSRNFFVNTQS